MRLSPPLTHSPDTSLMRTMTSFPAMRTVLMVSGLRLTKCSHHLVLLSHLQKSFVPNARDHQHPMELFLLTTNSNPPNQPSTSTLTRAEIVRLPTAVTAIVRIPHQHTWSTANHSKMSRPIALAPLEAPWGYTPVTTTIKI